MARRSRSGRGGTARDGYEHRDGRLGRVHLGGERLVGVGTGWQHEGDATVRELGGDELHVRTGHVNATIASLDGTERAGMSGQSVRVRVAVLFRRARWRGQNVLLLVLLLVMVTLRQVGLVHTVDAVVQVLQEPALDVRLELGEAAHLLGALVEAGLELVHHARIGRLRHGGLLALQVLQMLHRHLQDVGLFQLRVAGGL